MASASTGQPSHPGPWLLLEMLILLMALTLCSCFPHAISKSSQQSVHKIVTNSPYSRKKAFTSQQEQEHSNAICRVTEAQASRDLKHHGPPEPLSSTHTSSQPAPDFQCTKMHQSSENTDMCWEGKRRDLWVQDPSPVPEMGRWKTISLSEPSRENAPPFCSCMGEILDISGEAQKGLGKVPGQQQRTQKEVAVACQGTHQPALARQKRTVSNISHCRELILCQNLVFWERWVLTPHPARQASTGLWQWYQHRSSRGDLTSFLPERRKI